MSTATQQLLDHLIDGGVERYVVDRRDNGASWRRISLDIHDQFGVDVAHETLRTWFADLQTVSGDAA